MKIKHFIVTYNNAQRINSSLESIFDSGSDLLNVQVCIINNHSKLDIQEKFLNRVKIIQNQTRPDFSTGHLARNWNQAIINGFQDLDDPDCDVLITSQDDTLFKKNYVEQSVELSKKFDFAVYGTGDQFAIYTPSGVKKIGLWDERFCNIGYQEADYFLRAARYHDKISLNDHMHGRVYQSHDECPILNTTSGFMSGDLAHMKSMVYHRHSEFIFRSKWNFPSQYWGPDHLRLIRDIEPKIMSFVFYPYFENKISTLKDQKYLVP